MIQRGSPVVRSSALETRDLKLSPSSVPDLSKLLPLSELWFPHLRNVDNNHFWPLRMLWGLNETVCKVLSMEPFTGEISCHVVRRLKQPCRGTHMERN